jgi:hypothetical protein
MPGRERAPTRQPGRELNAKSAQKQDMPSRRRGKLNAVVAGRGGRPVTENGSLILERSPQDDWRRNGLEVFDELYEELPEGMKERHHLLPYLADYLL